MDRPSDEMMAALNVRIAKLMPHVETRWRVAYRRTGEGRWSLSVGHRCSEDASQAQADLRRNGREVGAPEAYSEPRYLDYTGSLDAIHEAVAVVPYDQQPRVIWHLKRLLMERTETQGASDWDVFTARAFEVAIALDRTLSKEPIL